MIYINNNNNNDNDFCYRKGDYEGNVLIREKRDEIVNETQLFCHHVEIATEK